MCARMYGYKYSLLTQRSLWRADRVPLAQTLHLLRSRFLLLSSTSLSANPLYKLHSRRCTRTSLHEHLSLKYICIYIIGQPRERTERSVVTRRPGARNCDSPCVSLLPGTPTLSPPSFQRPLRQTGLKRARSVHARRGEWNFMYVHIYVCIYIYATCDAGDSRIHDARVYRLYVCVCGERGVAKARSTTHRGLLDSSVVGAYGTFKIGAGVWGRDGLFFCNRLGDA